LTFTESEDAIYMGNRGLRDRQVVLLEALISIDDRGRNVGDLDILSMFSNPRFVTQTECPHTAEQKKTSLQCLPYLTDRLTSVDCWEEFLDPPERTAIFRASGNWQARLGAAAAAVQMGKNVLVLPENPCLHCLDGWEDEVIDIIVA
jgi:hypothetical protein